MKAGNKDPIAQNFAVLARLTDIFRQLADRCALTSETGHGGMRVFSGIRENGFASHQGIGVSCRLLTAGLLPG